MQPDRRRWRDLRDESEAAPVRAERRHRQDALELRPERGQAGDRQEPEPRRHVLVGGGRPPHLVLRPPLAVCPRRAHRQACSRLWPARSRRSSRRLRPRSRVHHDHHHHPRHHLQGSADYRQHLQRGPAGRARRHPRLRRPHGQAAMELPHDPAPRRIRLRHLAAGRLEVPRRGQQLVRHEPRREAEPGVRADRFGRLRFLRLEPRRRQPLRQHAAGAEGGHRRAGVALPGDQTRRLGPRFSYTAEPGHRAAERPPHRRRRPDHQVRARVRVRSRDWHAAVSDRVSPGAGLEHRRRSPRQDTALPAEAAAVLPAEIHRRYGNEAHARGAPGRTRAFPPPPQRRAVYSAEPRGQHRLPGLRRRRGMGRPGVRPRNRTVLRELQRNGLGATPGRALQGRGAHHRPHAVLGALRGMPSRRSQRQPARVPRAYGHLPEAR